MPTSALSIVTRGFIYPPQEITPVVCDKPVLTSVVEVKPRMLAKLPAVGSPSVSPPVIMSAEDLSPTIEGVEGPAQDASEDTPRVLSAEDLRPRIVKAEEE